MKSTPEIRQILQAANPPALLLSLATYLLGGGIAVYLGTSIDWAIYSLGQAAILCLILSCAYLKAYYDPFPPPREADSEPDPDEHSADHSAANRVLYFQIAAITLTGSAALTVLLFANQALNLAGFVLLGAALVLALAVAVPPIRLVYSGYGELAMGIVLINLTPALAFLLQTGELHRLLILVTLPLTFLYLASRLALSLPTYATDLRLERKNLLVRLGWPRALSVHNLLLFGCFLLLGVAAILGLPWRLAWPGMLGLPVAGFQAWQMMQIANGAKPNWNLWQITVLATLAVTLYFLIFSFWTA